MSWLGNILGGKKAPPPPPELRESARSIFNLAQGQQPRVGKFRGAVNSFLPILSNYSGQLQDDYNRTSARAFALGDNYGHLWADGGLPALRMAGQDAIAAGSPVRQEEEKRRAIEQATAGINSALRAREDQLRRRGNIGGGADSPHLSVLTGAALGATGNEARLRERQYGEAFRRSFAPIARDFGATGLNYMGQGGAARQMAFQGARLLPAETGNFFNAETGLASNVGGMFGNAQTAFGNSYKANLMKAQADAARKQAIFNNAFRVLKHFSKGASDDSGGGDGGGGAPQKQEFSAFDYAMKHALPALIGV